MSHSQEKKCAKVSLFILLVKTLLKYEYYIILKEKNDSVAFWLHNLKMKKKYLELYYKMFY